MHGLETGIIPLRDEIAYAETRGPPSQDPRDHIEQAIRHDNSQEKEHFDASKDNAV